MLVLGRNWPDSWSWIYYGGLYWAIRRILDLMSKLLMGYRMALGSMVLVLKLLGLKKIWVRLRGKEVLSGSVSLDVKLDLCNYWDILGTVFYYGAPNFSWI